MATATKKRAKTVLQPLGDRVVISRDESEATTAGGIVLPDSAQDKPSQGEVISVGEGPAPVRGERSRKSQGTPSRWVTRAPPTDGPREGRCPRLGRLGLGKQLFGEQRQVRRGVRRRRSSNHRLRGRRAAAILRERLRHCHLLQWQRLLQRRRHLRRHLRRQRTRQQRRRREEARGTAVEYLCGPRLGRLTAGANLAPSLALTLTQLRTAHGEGHGWG